MIRRKRQIELFFKLANVNEHTVRADTIVEEYVAGRREAHSAGSDAFQLELFKYFRLRAQLREVAEESELDRGSGEPYEERS